MDVAWRPNKQIKRRGRVASGRAIPKNGALGISSRSPAHRHLALFSFTTWRWRDDCSPVPCAALQIPDGRIVTNHDYVSVDRIALVRWVRYGCATLYMGDHGLASATPRHLSFARDIRPSRIARLRQSNFQAGRSPSVRPFLLSDPRHVVTFRAYRPTGVLFHCPLVRSYAS
jgi:hypothetical protein